MTVEITAITDADVPAVAEFLRDRHNDGVPWDRACAALPWTAAAPNHGFMIRDGQRVVGTLLALYSERVVAGRTERFCNLGSWCVLPEYRSRSISLLNALLAQDGYHFTVLSPDERSQEVLTWLKFRALDTSAALVPHLPWPTSPGATRISADPEVIERTLEGPELRLYRDHVHALAARHLMVTRDGETCYVMYRESRHKSGLVLAVILHVSNPTVFHRALPALTRHLLLRRGIVASLIELRFIDRKPRFSFALSRRPKMYRSASLDGEQIDDLYSELVCVPM
ncbi:hypothetical protein ACQI4F_16550 [Mycolicibacterium vaccae]|uniref:hypothetical protein n=1 Tax=Mycolicibacterium vaccae TaxID=1810 RepID=UPI003CE8C1C3